MKPRGCLLAATFTPIILPRAAAISTSSRGVFGFTFKLKSPRRRCCCFKVSRSSENFDAKTVSSHHSSQNGNVVLNRKPKNELLNFEVRSPSIPASIIPVSKLSLTDQTFLLLAFIGCTTCAAFTSFVVAAVPTLFAMRRAAISFAKLVDTAHEEIPSTMAAITLSGMEISDLTLELSDLSQEIADGANKSAQAVQAAEAGIRKIGAVACQQTMTMIEERASLPVISLQPVVAGAAKKTSRAVGQATKTFFSIISRDGGGAKLWPCGCFGAVQSQMLLMLCFNVSVTALLSVSLSIFDLEFRLHELNKVYAIFEFCILVRNMKR